MNILSQILPNLFGNSSDPSPSANSDQNNTNPLSAIPSIGGLSSLENLFGGGIDVSTIKGYIQHYGLTNTIPSDVMAKLDDGKITPDELLPIATKVFGMMQNSNNPLQAPK